MKLNKKLMTAITAPALTAVALAPVAVLASCGNKSYAEETRDVVLQEFKKMCEIPHSSDKILYEAPIGWGQVWEMSCYLRDRITQILGPRTVHQDAWGNLWFDVPANDEAYRDYPIVGLQAHMDMVFNYDKNKFEKEPDPTTTKIECVDEIVDGKRVLHSKDYKTTLGADDGIGVSTIIALVQSKTIKHGPLRVIFTNCEEKAMQGAEILVGKEETADPDVFKNLNFMINLDGEDLGDICVGCSGGVGSYYDQAFEYTDITNGKDVFTVVMYGFKGGHSGTDISNFVCNPIKVMTELLNRLITKDTTIELVDFETPGVTVYNKIPDSCVMKVATSLTAKTIEDTLKDVFDFFKKEKSSPEDARRGEHPLKYEGEDWDTIEEQTKVFEDILSTKSIKTADVQKIINLQSDLEFGVRVWPSDSQMAQFTGEQTSASCGPISISDEFEEGDKTYVSYSFASYSRSTDKDKVSTYASDNASMCETLLGKTVAAGEKKGKSTYSSDAQFPSWENKYPEMSELAKKGWLAAGVPADKVAFSRTHGGIENAWWCKANPFIRQTSIGAQLHDCHEVKETCEVDSIVPMIKTVVYMLQHVNEIKL